MPVCESIAACVAELRAFDAQELSMPQIASRLATYQQLLDHASWTIWAARFATLATLISILRLALVLSSVALVLFLFRDVVRLFSLGLLSLLLKKPTIALLGYGFSAPLLYHAVPLMTDDLRWVVWTFIWSWCGEHAVLLGGAFTQLTTLYLLPTLRHKEMHEWRLRQAALVLFWAGLAVWHQHSMCGAVAVLLLFKIVGFQGRAIDGGYSAGFDQIQGVWVCWFVSVLLNAWSFAAVTSVLPQLHVFDMGIRCIGTLVGAIAVIILVHRDDNHVDRDVMALLVGFFYFLGLIAIGLWFNCEAMRNIGGVFLVFSALDLQLWLTRALNPTPWLCLLVLSLAGLIQVFQRFLAYATVHTA